MCSSLQNIKHYLSVKPSFCLCFLVRCKSRHEKWHGDIRSLLGNEAKWDSLRDLHLPSLPVKRRKHEQVVRMCIVQQTKRWTKTKDPCSVFFLSSKDLRKTFQNFSFEKVLKNLIIFGECISRFGPRPVCAATGSWWDHADLAPCLPASNPPPLFTNQALHFGGPPLP